MRLVLFLSILLSKVSALQKESNKNDLVSLSDTFSIPQDVSLSVKSIHSDLSHLKKPHHHATTVFDHFIHTHIELVEMIVHLASDIGFHIIDLIQSPSFTNLAKKFWLTVKNVAVFLLDLAYALWLCMVKVHSIALSGIRKGPEGLLEDALKWLDLWGSKDAKGKVLDVLGITLLAGEVWAGTQLPHWIQHGFGKHADEVIKIADIEKKAKGFDPNGYLIVMASFTEEVMVIGNAVLIAEKRQGREKKLGIEKFKDELQISGQCKASDDKVFQYDVQGREVHAYVEDALMSLVSIIKSNVRKAFPDDATWMDSYLHTSLFVPLEKDVQSRISPLGGPEEVERLAFMHMRSSVRGLERKLNKKNVKAKLPMTWSISEQFWKDLHESIGALKLISWNLQAELDKRTSALVETIMKQKPKLDREFVKEEIDSLSASLFSVGPTSMESMQKNVKSVVTVFAHGDVEIPDTVLTEFISIHLPIVCNNNN